MDGISPDEDEYGSYGIQTMFRNFGECRNNTDDGFTYYSTFKCNGTGPAMVLNTDYFNDDCEGDPFSQISYGNLDAKCGSQVYFPIADTWFTVTSDCSTMFTMTPCVGKDSSENIYDSGDIECEPLGQNCRVKATNESVTMIEITELPDPKYRYPDIADAMDQTGECANKKDDPSNPLGTLQIQLYMDDPLDPTQVAIIAAAGCALSLIIMGCLYWRHKNKYPDGSIQEGYSHMG